MRVVGGGSVRTGRRGSFARYRCSPIHQEPGPLIRLFVIFCADLPGNQRNRSLLQKAAKIAKVHLVGSPVG
jgi:hypothetical protein